MYNQRTEDLNKVYINEEIRATEVRCMGPDGENFGVLSTSDAMLKARELGLDLIEVSAKAVPPVAKIMDYGKFTYEQKKKAKETKAKSHVTETKSVQVKIGTGERDKELKAERVDEWLAEGHRVKIDLFLWGRYKYMEAGFLTERLNRFLVMVFVPYKVADPIKRSPKGFSCTLERDKIKPLPTKDELETMREELKKAKKAKRVPVDEPEEMEEENEETNKQ
ncbi:MAG: translation initiation factor IF-3 [Candidatus Pacebacteria bacterium]|nr:translation initiation factor IF-3 [Candidatus Paceibacterota bacterium]